MARPNFVFFIPDQLRADSLGSFGNRHVRTPNIDRFADRAVRFEQAFAQHPVCSPSRASFLTGLYPHTSGHRTLTNLIKPWEPNLLRSLHDAGYAVTWIGRRGDTFAPGATEASVDEYGFSIEPNVPVNRIYPDDLSARLFYRGKIEGEGRIDNDEAITRSAVEWLRSPPQEPWVLFLPMNAPHCPFEVEDPWFSMYADAPVDPPTGADTFSDSPRFRRAIRERYGLERASAEDWLNVKRVYYGMISRLDDQFGRVMQALAAAPSGENTVTLFFADHGEYLGDHGLIEKWPSALDDCILRDPLIIGGAGLPEGGVVRDMVELIDIVPTVAELAEIELPYRQFGKSLVDAMEGTPRQHREYAFSEGGFLTEEEPVLERGPFPYDLKGLLQHEDPTLVGRAISVRSTSWTYVWRFYEGNELYDRAADPLELVNLSGAPDLSGVESGLRLAILDWLIETSDTTPLTPDPRYPDVDLPRPGEGRQAAGTYR